MMTKTSPKMGLILTMIILIILAFCCQTALAVNGEPRLETDKRIYQGEDIRVRFYNAPGYASDWICIVPEGAPDSEAGDYQYMPGGNIPVLVHFLIPVIANPALPVILANVLIVVVTISRLL
ncbi:MAG: hypothetical protein CVU51_11245 [Deltaproteobacteria bacterium HGW-Deltaproteobacteria-1]|nr:MAG: hypothetical protein CVU51_11245 [Deltaproteobacteria bacterium HGW-Deltaproteobacteria-1]